MKQFGEKFGMRMLLLFSLIAVTAALVTGFVAFEFGSITGGVASLGFGLMAFKPHFSPDGGDGGGGSVDLLAKGINDKIESYKSKITELETKIANGETKHNETVAKMQEQLDALEKKANELEVTKKTNSKECLIKEFADGIAKVKSMIKGSNEEIEVKADTLRASVEDSNATFQVDEIGQLLKRRVTMYDLFRKIPIGSSNTNGIITYTDWDEATTVRAANMVAEGVAFPESTAKWKTYTLPLRKVGDTLPVSEEFYEDQARFAAELDNFLRTNVELKVEDQLISGNNTGQQLQGLLNRATAFNATGLTKVEDATFYDLIAVVGEQITKLANGKYMPNFVAMNKSGINKMRLVKDKNENYIIPPFVTRDGREVDGLVVIEANFMPDNTFVVGDSSKGKIYEKNGFIISKGHIGDQFAEDMETLKVKKRLAFLIHEQDRTGFVKVTDIDAAITAITKT